MPRDEGYDKEIQNLTPLVTKYNPHTTYIAEIAHRHWRSLKSKEWFSKIFAELPALIAYRRPENPLDKLVSTKFKEKVKEEDTNGYKPCGRTGCSWHRKIYSTTTFFGLKGRAHFQDMPQIRLSFSMGNLYDGMQNLQITIHRESETKCNIRFKNHQSHIKNSINSCKLSEYFLHNRQTHNFEIIMTTINATLITITTTTTTTDIIAITTYYYYILLQKVLLQVILLSSYYYFCFYFFCLVLPEREKKYF